MYMNGRFVPNSTTATRRAERILNTRWLHISQWFKPVEKKDEKTGVATVVPEAQFTCRSGDKLIPCGRTYRKAVVS